MVLSCLLFNSMSFNLTLSVKLDRSNYLVWRSQFISFLRGHQLVGFNYETHPCPPEFIYGDNSSNEVLNPQFFMWQCKDQLLLGWLISSISELILSQVVGLATSRDVWVTLGKQFSSLSHGFNNFPLNCRLLPKAHCQCLSILKKKKKSKSIADDLALIS